MPHEEWMVGKTIGEICKIKGWTIQQYFKIQHLDDYYGTTYPSDWKYQIVADPNKNIRVTRGRRTGELTGERELVEDIPFTEEEWIRARNQYPDKVAHYLVLSNDPNVRAGEMANLIGNSLAKCQLERTLKADNCSNKENHRTLSPMDEWILFPRRCKECGSDLK